jgi:hypothetical protein
MPEKVEQKGSPRYRTGKNAFFTSFASEIGIQALGPNLISEQDWPGRNDWIARYELIAQFEQPISPCRVL